MPERAPKNSKEIRRNTKVTSGNFTTAKISFTFFAFASATISMNSNELVFCSCLMYSIPRRAPLVNVMTFS